MIIQHRVNTKANLHLVPHNHGVEIDLRLFNGELILAHDPFIPGEKFIDWIENYNHKMLILNVKEDGLEKKITEILDQKNLKNYFFLDQPFPTLRKSSLSSLPVALRLSEYENPIELKDLKISWVWLDSFTGDWSILNRHSAWLRNGKFNLCIVSPELQGRNCDFEELNLIVDTLKKEKLDMTAVCTKNPEKWKQFQ